MACQRLCTLPGMGNQAKPLGFDSRVLATGREFSREMIIPREGSRESRGSDVSVFSGGSPKTTLHLPVDVQDAIITLVRKETATICDPITSKLLMLQNEIDYMSNRLSTLQNVPSGGLGDPTEVPTALRDLVQKTTDALNTLAMHDCRLQETENNLQEMASLQRELAAKTKDQPELVQPVVPQHQHETRLAKLESRFAELNETVSRDLAAFAKQAYASDDLEPAHHKAPKHKELTQVQGDQGCDIERQGSQDSFQHEPWLAELLPQQKSDPRNDPLDKRNGIMGPVESSQITLEENDQSKALEIGVWYYFEGSASHSFEIAYRNGQYVFMQDSQSTEGTLVRGSEWLEGHIKRGSIRMKLTNEGQMVSQFKPDNGTFWQEPTIASRDAPVKTVPKPPKTSYFRIPKWGSSRNSKSTEKRSK